jgi:UDP-glucuronate 4-epimerase
MGMTMILERTGDRPVLVTGAAGFIGSHLVETLLAGGQPVVGVDCFTDYYAAGVKERNLAKALTHPCFRFVHADVATMDLGQLVGAASCVYHLAGQPGVRGSWGQRFEEYVRNNILATQRLLESCLAAGGTPVVYASSSSVYGNLSTMPLREDMTLAPVSPYGVTKLAAEHLCRLYAAVYGLPTLSLRLFTVYGPRQRPDMAFSRFLTAAAAGDEITVYGDGTQTRDFTFVEDVVAAFVAGGDLLSQAATEGRGRGQVVNIAGGSCVSVREVLAAVARLTGARLRIRQLPPQPGDVQDTWADTTAARELLDFGPRVSLLEGLEAEWNQIRQRALPA